MGKRRQRRNGGIYEQGINSRRGAAGMMAALSAAGKGHCVTVFEKNEKLGKKIYITGKGRCNVTNACEPQELYQSVVSNSKFLYSAFSRFDNQAVQDFFEANGCPLKTERGGRVFPVSDHSSDIIRALSSALEKAGVEIRLHTPVKKLLVKKAEDGSNAIRGLKLLSGEEITADAWCLPAEAFPTRLQAPPATACVWRRSWDIPWFPVCPHWFPSI